MGGGGAPTILLTIRWQIDDNAPHLFGGEGHFVVRATMWAMTQIVRTLKDTGVAYLFAVLLGGFAAHRLYLGYIGTAFAFMGLWFGGLLLMNYGGLVAVVAAVIWWVVDLFRLPRLTHHANARVAASV